MDFLDIDPETVECFSKLRLLEVDPLVLLPSRITRRKNIELALRVIELLRDPLPHIRLVVTGPPGPHNPDNASYVDELKALCASLELNDQVLFLTETLGTPPDDGMMKALYRVSIALIFPSFEEGFGLPILEAELARLPVFCADIPALRELATLGSNVRCGDAKHQPRGRKRSAQSRAIHHADESLYQSGRIIN